MRNGTPISIAVSPRLAQLGAFAGLLFFVGMAHSPAQPNSSPASQPESSVVLDHAVAVVNDQLILASDLDDAIQLAVLDPNQGGQGELTPQRALEELISRTLIEQ